MAETSYIYSSVRISYCGKGVQLWLFQFLSYVPFLCLINVLLPKCHSMRICMKFSKLKDEYCGQDILFWLFQLLSYLPLMYLERGLLKICLLFMVLIRPKRWIVAKDHISGFSISKVICSSNI